MSQILALCGVALTHFGLSVSCVDIEFEDPLLLLAVDVVEILGGNPFYLLNQLRMRATKAVLTEIAKNKVLIGVSAGSAVLQKSISLIAQYSPEMNDGINITDLAGLALTDVEILPHYKRFLNRFESFEERAQAYEQRNHCTVIRLNDGEGVMISQDDVYQV